MGDIPYKRGSFSKDLMTTDPVKGYKGFYKVGDNKFVCMDKIYKCPGIEYINCEPKLCQQGIHFCLDIRDALKYYPPHKGELHVAEVLAIGTTIIGYDKCVTNKIVLIEEVDLYDLCNKYNSGSHNIGECNIGHKNSGNKNIGSCNKGNLNIGDYNNGGVNFGDRNTGIRNIGDRNVGDTNIGRCNSGSNNIGNYNFGSCSIGCFNNSIDGGVGCFNTEPGVFRMFNKPCNRTSLQTWYHSKAYDILIQMPNLTELQPVCAQTVAERQQWWESLGPVDKQDVVSMENFDPEIFHLITGIRVGDTNFRIEILGEPKFEREPGSM